MSFELQPHLVGGLLELRPLRPEDWLDVSCVLPLGGEYNGEMKRLMLGHAFPFVDSVLTDRWEEVDLNGVIVAHLVYQIKKPA